MTNWGKLTPRARNGLMLVAWAAVVFSLVQIAIQGTEDGVQRYTPAMALAALIVWAGRARIVAKLLVVALAVSVLIQVWEVWHGTYLFAVERRGVLLDANLYSGMHDFLRAKGLFTGPVTASLFGVAVTVLWRGRREVWLLALVGAVLAQGRMAVLLLVAGALLFGLQTRDGRTQRVTRRARRWGLAGVAGFLGWFFFLADPYWRANYLAAFDLSDPRNQGRFRYWGEAARFIWDGGLVDLLLGRPGATYAALGNSAESDYLQLLSAVGVLGVVLVVAGLWWATRLSERRNRWLLLLAVSAAASAGNSSVFLGLVLWLAVFEQQVSEREPAAAQHLEGSVGDVGVRGVPADVHAHSRSA